MKTLVSRMVLVVFCLHGLPVSGGDLYVSPGGDNSTYDAWSTAYTNVQDAFNAAADGDTIHVAGGTFALSSRIAWGANQNVTVRGGYAATNDAPLPGARDPRQWPTVFTPASGTSARIMDVANVTNGVLEGVTLSGGKTIGYVAGMLVSNCVDFSLLSCSILSNHVDDAVGNIYGGGLYITGSSASISNSLIADNTIVGDRYDPPLGAGICIDSGSTVTLRDSRITRNLGHLAQASTSKKAQGGGMYSAGNTTLRNCVISYNEARHNAVSDGWEPGDGIYCAGGSLVLENCNVLYNLDEGIYVAAGTVSATNSIFWGNIDDINGTVALSHCCIEDGDDSGNNGNFSSDPLFEYGEYLGSGSDCIDGGTGAGFLVGGTYTTSADGTPDSGTVDVGYHYAAGYGPVVTDLYVSPDGDDGNTGLSREQAKRSISAALTAATDGSALHIASGQYTEAVETFPLTIRGKRNVRLLGTNASDTVVDATGAGDRVLTVQNAPETVIEGITITGASAQGVDGGGLLLASCMDAQVLSCNIVSNYTGTTSGSCIGGGLSINYGSTTISNCTIESNTAQGGRWNTTYGGGVYLDNGAAVLMRDCVLTKNFANINNASANAKVYGGALWSAGHAVLRNCLITYNEARHNTADPAGDEFGSGLYCAKGSLTLENCTIAHNVGEGIYQAGGDCSVVNGILWGNVEDIVGTVSLSYSCIEDGDGVPDNGNIDSDPLLEQGYHLGAGSPCIDTGINAEYLVENGYTTRTDGSDDTGTVDMGYHYFSGGGAETYSDLYVSPDGADINSGTNWFEAKRSISAALSLAAHGTAIHIASGRYTNGLETFPLTVSYLDGVLLRGTNMHETIVDASGSAERVFTFDTSPNLRLEGLTITGGNVDGNGGGILMNSCSGNSRIYSCIVTNNKTTGNGRSGGGISIEGSTMVSVSNCLVAANHAGTDYHAFGGGISIRDNSVVAMSHCRIIMNRAALSGHGSAYGGGINNQSTLSMRNCLVAHNYNRFYSGFYLTGNERGDAIYSTGTLQIENCTIVDNNSITNEGIEIVSGTASITNSILWGNGGELPGSAVLGYSNIEGEGTANGNISEDPLFRDAASHDYRLNNDSPCVNSGYNLPWDLQATDLDGNPRRQGNKVDMGCYESAAKAATLLILR